MNNFFGEKTWFDLDYKLDEIEFNGPSNFRFPKELAELVIEEFCPEQGWVLDPFLGFGTTTSAAQTLNRNAVGFEVDTQRFNFAKKEVKKPSLAINDRIQNIGNYELPAFDLIFTSPPYASFTGERNDPVELYVADLCRIFSGLAPYLKPTGNLVLEIANVIDDRGILPLAWHSGLALSKIFTFGGERVICHKNSDLGYNHSYLLTYSLR